jgi:hypothetical protein
MLLVQLLPEMKWSTSAMQPRQAVIPAPSRIFNALAGDLAAYAVDEETM